MKFPTNTTAYKISVMQAFERGERVEYIHSHPAAIWSRIFEPIWDWSKFDYRVVPKPLEVKATVIGDNVIAWVQNSSMDATNPQRVVLFREVIE